jgi:hypothetical protein
MQRAATNQLALPPPPVIHLVPVEALQPVKPVIR